MAACLAGKASNSPARIFRKVMSLNGDSFYSIEGDFVAGVVVEPGGLRAGMVGDLLGLLDDAAVLAEGGDAGGAEGVAAGALG
jgi:hypothetical protein